MYATQVTGNNRFLKFFLEMREGKPIKTSFHFLSLSKVNITSTIKHCHIVKYPVSNLFSETMRFMRDTYFSFSTS